jgi:hypothetical protein
MAIEHHDDYDHVSVPEAARFFRVKDPRAAAPDPAPAHPAQEPGARPDLDRGRTMTRHNSNAGTRKAPAMNRPPFAAVRAVQVGGALMCRALPSPRSVLMCLVLSRCQTGADRKIGRIMTNEPEAPVALYRALTAAARCAYQGHGCTCVPDISVIGGGDDVSSSTRPASA